MFSSVVRPASGPSASRSARGAEAAREHKVRACLGEAMMELAHLLRRVEDPLLRCDARLDPHVLVVRPGRAVRDEYWTLGKQVGKRSHRASVRPQPRPSPVQRRQPDARRPMAIHREIRNWP